MGRKIAKKIRGMRWAAKVSLVLVFAVLFGVTKDGFSKVEVSLHAKMFRNKISRGLLVG